MYLNACIKTSVRPSPSAFDIATHFGLGLDTRHRFPIADNLHISLAPSQILFITGPSGSGKSTLIKILKKSLTPNLDLEKISFQPKKILPDQFPLPLPHALHYLALAGLADAFILLRTPSELSDGQRYRLKLALAFSKSPPLIIADQFLDSLDRLTAKIIAANTRKFALRYQTALILASPHNDFVPQLKPDFLIEKPFAAPAQIKHFPRRSSKTT
ncbi:MAG: ATP-binding cassette domain-containing protein [Phycisphaerae bacterium]|nr:ATP-binding cassette domain-containing protein [Phycisphaerae bacterium]